MQLASPRAKAPIEKQRSLLAEDTSISMASYSIWIPAIEWDGPTPSAYVSPTATTPGYWLFGRGTESYVYAYCRRPIYWQVGHIEPIVHISASVEDESHLISFGYSWIEHSVAIPAMTWNSATITPTVADAIFFMKPKDAIDTDYGTPAWATGTINPRPVAQYAQQAIGQAVPPDHKGLYLGVAKNILGDSLETGNICFYGAELIFYQHESPIGGKAYGDYHLGDTRYPTY